MYSPSSLRLIGSNDISDCNPTIKLSLRFSMPSCCPGIKTLLLLVLYQTICNESTASSSLVALHVRLVLFPSTVSKGLVM